MQPMFTFYTISFHDINLTCCENEDQNRNLSSRDQELGFNYNVVVL